MLCSRPSERLVVDSVGWSRWKVDAVGDDVWTRVSSESWTFGSCRRLGMLRTLPSPRSRGRVSRSAKVSGMRSVVGDGSGEEIVEELVSNELCIDSLKLCIQIVPPE